MILLEKYIKAFLKEAASSAIMSPASELTGKKHHQIAASYNVNMTELDPEETLLKVLENVGDNCFISFVEKYDEKVPRLEISPEVSYDTPHGNYAYPLNIKSLKDIVEKGRVGGANFALDRPYFHMFKKSDSLNYIEIQPNGTNNYSGNYSKDLRTIVHTAVMFNAARNLEKNPDKYVAPPDTEDETYRKIRFDDKQWRVRKKIKDNTKTSETNNESFYKILNILSEDLCYLVNLNNKKYPREFVELIVDFLVNTLKIKINSFQNKFFVRIKGKRKLLSKFHGLYYACFMLAKGMSDDVDKKNNPQNNSIRQGSIFTMLLNSIDIDFINDRGSKTLHDHEPIQAVYLNSSKKENVVLVGTFNNIFKTKDINNIYELIPPIGESNKTVTMNKIVNILEQNPKLNDLFGTELFDDVKLKHPLADLREKAWQDLTKKKHKFFDFILFHSSNKIFNFNIYRERDGSKLIVFNIGIKEKFLNSSIKKQLKIINKEMPEIVKIEDKLTYIQVFLSKHRNKSIYGIKDTDGYDNIKKTLDRIQDHTANLEWFSLKSDEEKTSFLMVKTFINICEEISHLAGIATYQ